MKIYYPVPVVVPASIPTNFYIHLSWNKTKKKMLPKMSPNFPYTSYSLSINLNNMIYNDLERSLNVLKPQLLTDFFIKKIL